MSEQFSKAQDGLLVKEAVAVRPFSQGKGLGWKMIATKIAKSTHLFPTPLKAKATRERILYLMDDYCQRSTEEEDCDSLDEEQLSMDQNLQQLVSLRDQAVKMATQNRSVNSVEMETEEERKTSDGEADQEIGHRAQTAKVVEEKEGTKDSDGLKNETQQSPTTNSGLNVNKDLCQASKSLHNCFQTVYEDGWPEKELMQEQLKTCDLLWNDYMQNLQDSVVVPLNSFLQHFPTFKSKVSKRGRKLTDFDNARHQLEVLNAAKKRDELKIEKAQEDLKESKRIYEEMNHELLVEMPAFYNSRCHFISTLFTSLFGTEFVFHSEIGKVSAAVGDSCQKLANQSEPMDLKLNTSISVHSENGTSGLSSPTSPSNSEPPTSPAAIEGPSPVYLNQSIQEEKQDKRQMESNINGGDGGVDDDDNEDDDDSETDSDNSQSGKVIPLPRHDSPMASKDSSLKGSDKVKVESNYVKGHDEEEDEGHNNKGKEDGNFYEEPASPIVGLQNGKGQVADKDDGADGDDDDDDDDSNDEDSEKNLYTDTPINTPVHQPPPGTLYQVQATHRYTGEDVDELNFEPGEIIYVIKFENPEEQDDGWQMGIKQTDGIKGVFPENFTRKI